MRLIVPLLIALLVSRWGAAGIPQEAGFTDNLYVSSVHEPTCIAWAPDGSNRLFVSLKSEGIAIIANGQIQASLFAAIADAYTASECGVLGLAFDPDFATNHYVYVFVTVSGHEQQIVRFTDQNSIGTQRTLILGGLPTAGINHDGGALAFGPDGRIYFAIGDNGIKRGVDGDLTSLAAKVGRCNKDGSVPADNPFNDGTGPNNDYILATGFRNPFTMTFQPGTGKLWLNVVGSTPDGQTVPKSGPGYEQVFVVHAGDDGGYDDYEGNQPSGPRYNTPFPRPLIRPKIQYKTDYFGDGALIRQIAGAQRSGGMLTVTTSQSHPYRVGQAVTISGVTSLNGDYTVQATPSATTFTAAAEGPALSANSGEVDALVQGGSITGGCFYTSNAFPLSHRGNFFYGDYVSGYIMRAELDESGKPLRITRFVEGAGTITDTAVGPDGAVYYANIAGEIRYVSFAGEQQGIVVSPTTLQLVEGGSASFVVRLSAPPDAPLTIQVHKTGAIPAAEHEIDITSGGPLTFTPENWEVPQQVTLTALVDDDAAPDTATFTVTAPGLEPVNVQATANDENLAAFVLSTSNLEVQEGKAVNFTLALATQPAAPVKVRVRPSGGQKGKVTLVKGSLLRFTAKNWNLPHTIRVRGNQDANSADQNTTLSVHAAGYRTGDISVLVRDDDPSRPLLIVPVKTQAVVGFAVSGGLRRERRSPADVYLDRSSGGNDDRSGHRFGDLDTDPNGDIRGPRPGRKRSRSRRRRLFGDGQCRSATDRVHPAAARWFDNLRKQRRVLRREHRRLHDVQGGVLYRRATCLHRHQSGESLPPQWWTQSLRHDRPQQRPAYAETRGIRR
jgi:glucose/arabinose dehydrogenase